MISRVDNGINVTGVKMFHKKSAPTPKMRLYKEGYFMNRTPINEAVAPKKNIISSFLKNVAKLIKG